MRAIPAPAIAVALLPRAHSQTKVLQIYSLDVEGGQSTLVVSPYGESALASTDGTFLIINTRNELRRTYGAGTGF